MKLTRCALTKVIPIAELNGCSFFKGHTGELATYGDGRMEFCPDGVGFDFEVKKDEIFIPHAKTKS